MQKRSKAESHVTPYGFHAYRAFRECPRRYYYSYRYNRGMESKVGNISTTGGTVFHAFCHAWHKLGDAKRAKAAAQREFEKECARWEIFRDPSKVHDVQQTITSVCDPYPDLDRDWQKKNGALTFLEFEEFKRIDIQAEKGTSPFTSRRDAVVRWQGEIFVFETKLSILARDRMRDMHRAGGQVSGYVMVEREKTPGCSGALLNHMRPLKAPELYRTPIPRTEPQLTRWAERMVSIWADLQACDITGHWPMDEDACITYTTACPFRDVCACDGEEEQRRVLDTFYRPRT